MIPKVIHYCWFGGKPLPKSAVKCIASWRKFLPDYEIKEWNESNFDVNCTQYTSEAYAAHKYAYVSDYARFWVLYRYGGLYFDVDVEVIKPLDDIIARGPFMGCESACTGELDGSANSGLCLGVAPGLGLGVNPKVDLIKALLDKYEHMSYLKELQVDKYEEIKTVVTYTSELLVERGLKNVGTIQCIDGIYIYPKEYFNPLEHINQLHVTENTRTIHWYNGSWIPRRYKFYRSFVRFIGPKMYSILLAMRNCLKK